MANSSEWIGSLAKPGDRQPTWLTAFEETGEFAEGLPFARSTASPRPSTGGPQPDEAEIALARAHEEGEAAGRAAAEAELRGAEDNRRALRLAFRALDQAAMDALAGELVETVIELCGQVLGECAIDRHRIAERAKAAAKKLGAAPDQIKLHLHPDDVAELGDDVFAGSEVVPDSELPRGALRLESADGEVHDGPDQWRRAIVEALRA